MNDDPIIYVSTLPPVKVDRCTWCDGEAVWMVTWRAYPNSRPDPACDGHGVRIISDPRTAGKATVRMQMRVSYSEQPRRRRG